VAASRLTGKPVVCHVHGYLDIGPKRTTSLNRHVDRFVVISQFIADPWLASGIDASKVEVVHNGIDPADYPAGQVEERRRARAELGIPDDDRLVVTYLGRLDREKGVDVLLDAWRRLDPPNPATLLLVGSSVVDHDGGQYVRELESMATGDVRFIPLRRDVIAPLHAADVVVVPSVWDEPFGRTVIEGLATGRPVVASRVGGIPEILTGPLERLLFERGNAEELAARIRSLSSWRVDEPSLGPACTERVTGSFTLSRMADGIERAFAGAIDGRRGRGGRGGRASAGDGA
jgi:glycosyltransferase involved in cell wall biosynthesis